MVRGLDRFREHFAGLEDRYVLIGGAAVDVAMDAAGLEFRLTKDLDIVLLVESLDAEFGRVFWEFVQDGGYDFRHRSTGAARFYRFHSPSEPSYPAMLELFARRPDALALPPRCRACAPARRGRGIEPLGDPARRRLLRLRALGRARRRRSHAAWRRAPHSPQSERLAGSDRAPGARRGGRQQRHQEAPQRRGAPLPAHRARHASRAAAHHRRDMRAFLGRALDDGFDPRSVGVRGATVTEIAAVLRAVYGVEA